MPLVAVCLCHFLDRLVSSVVAITVTLSTCALVGNSVPLPACRVLWRELMSVGAVGLSRCVVIAVTNAVALILGVRPPPEVGEAVVALNIVVVQAFLAGGAHADERF